MENGTWEPAGFSESISAQHPHCLAFPHLTERRLRGEAWGADDLAGQVSVTCLLQADGEVSGADFKAQEHHFKGHYVWVHVKCFMSCFLNHKSVGNNWAYTIKQTLQSFSAISFNCYTGLTVVVPWFMKLILSMILFSAELDKNWIKFSGQVRCWPYGEIWFDLPPVCSQNLGENWVHELRHHYVKADLVTQNLRRVEGSRADSWHS